MPGFTLSTFSAMNWKVSSCPRLAKVWSAVNSPPHKRWIFVGQVWSLINNTGVFLDHQIPISKNPSLLLGLTCVGVVQSRSFCWYHFDFFTGFSILLLFWTKTKLCRDCFITKFRPSWLTFQSNIFFCWNDTYNYQENGFCKQPHFC